KLRTNSFYSFNNPTKSLQFRPINVKHDFSCSCPIGFTGTNISVMSDTEFNLCYSNPCGQNGDLESLSQTDSSAPSLNLTGSVNGLNRDVITTSDYSSGLSRNNSANNVNNDSNQIK
ncbi:unnamed protein product, partial [Brachionus calyciflorus]